MSFTVLWRPDAERPLAAIWNDAADKRVTTEAANQLDLILKRNPSEAGESRSYNVRLIIVRPLVALFEVDNDDRRATVLSVALIE